MLKRNNKPLEDVLKSIAEKNGLKYVSPEERKPLKKITLIDDDTKEITHIKYNENGELESTSVTGDSPLQLVQVDPTKLNEAMAIIERSKKAHVHLTSIKSGKKLVKSSPIEVIPSVLQSTDE